MKVGEKIALIYFSRNVASEGRMKAWFSGKAAEQNKVLASTLIHQSSSALQQAGFPVFHYHENNQQGTTFGERIANACQEVFALGYDAVITVGNDCPEIGSTNWSVIRQQLSAGNCVVGPSLRRGAYLIGITREAFNKEQFQQLPWQTNKLLDALLRFCTVSHRQTHVLNPLRDINTLVDVKALLKSSSLNRYVKRILLSLFFYRLTSVTHQPASFLSSPLLSGSPFRAPPVLILS